MKINFKLYSRCLRILPINIAKYSNIQMTTMDKLLIKQYHQINGIQENRQGQYYLAENQLQNLISNRKIIEDLENIYLVDDQLDLLHQFIGDLNPQYFDKYPFPSLKQFLYILCIFQQNGIRIHNNKELQIFINNIITGLSEKDLKTNNRGKLDYTLYQVLIEFVSDINRLTQNSKMFAYINEFLCNVIEKNLYNLSLYQVNGVIQSINRSSFLVSDALFNEIIKKISNIKQKTSRFQIIDQANIEHLQYIGILNDTMKFIFNFLSYQREKIIDIETFKKFLNIINNAYIDNIKKSKSIKSIFYVYSSQSKLLEYYNMQEYINILATQIKKQNEKNLKKFKIKNEIKHDYQMISTLYTILCRFQNDIYTNSIQIEQTTNRQIIYKDNYETQKQKTIKELKQYYTKYQDVFNLLSQISIHDTPNQAEYNMSYSRYFRSLFLLSALDICPQPQLLPLYLSIPQHTLPEHSHDIDHTTESVIKSFNTDYFYDHSLNYRQVDFYIPSLSLVIECEGYGHTYRSQTGSVYYLQKTVQRNMSLLLDNHRLLMVTHDNVKQVQEEDIRSAIQHMIDHPDILLYQC